MIHTSVNWLSFFKSNFVSNHKLQIEREKSNLYLDHNVKINKDLIQLIFFKYPPTVTPQFTFMYLYLMGQVSLCWAQYLMQISIINTKLSYNHLVSLCLPQCYSTLEGMILPSSCFMSPSTYQLPGMQKVMKVLTKFQ